ncbi:Glyceraldehyde-3-phosphate dehydrogenase 3, partial [Frankliniella fusca]
NISSTLYSDDSTDDTDDDCKVTQETSNGPSFTLNTSGMPSCSNTPYIESTHQRPSTSREINSIGLSYQNNVQNHLNREERPDLKVNGKDNERVNLCDLVKNLEVTGEQTEEFESVARRIFVTLIQVIADIDLRTKSIHEDLKAILLLLEARPASSAQGTKAILETLNDLEEDTLPGFVSFGPQLSVPLKKVKKITESSDILQTKVNNLTLLVLKDDVVNYAKRIPKGNPLNLKLFPQNIIKKMTDVINEGNREVAFGELVKRERHELKKLTKTEEIAKKLEEIRTISNAQCRDLQFKDISDQLSHTLYNARQLINQKKDTNSLETNETDQD